MNDAAFEALFRSLHPSLCAFANTYLHDRDAAQEAVQDVFLVLWQKRDTIEIRTSMRAYVFAALRNHLLNKSARLKLEQRWFDTGDLPDDVANQEPLPIDNLERAEVAAVVQRAVDELPSACRAVVQLRFQNDMSYAEIAEALSIAPKTVENHLARAKTILKNRLGGFS